VDEHFGLLVGGDLLGGVDRTGLGRMDAGHPTVPLALDGPTAIVRDDVLVLSHLGPPNSKQDLGMIH
jgi:hypothetical protein